MMEYILEEWSSRDYHTIKLKLLARVIERICHLRTANKNIKTPNYHVGCQLLKHDIDPYHMHELRGYCCTSRGNHPSECSSAEPICPCFCPFYEAIQDTLGFSQPTVAD